MEVEHALAYVLAAVAIFTAMMVAALGWYAGRKAAGTLFGNSPPTVTVNVINRFPEES